MTLAPKKGAYELPAGTLLGKYEIVRKLATGGMAEIYLARIRGTAGFEKLVVLKRILPNVAEDPTFVHMFLDEARLAATLQHPNIADVYDVGDADGVYFFTMEYVHGQDVRAIKIASRKSGEPVPVAIALAIVYGIASALDYAHTRKGPDGLPLGLVHRDVSTSNILVSYDGAVKLVDFGIARAAGAQHKTLTGTLKGKIPYMSPEQCKGLPLDARSDLFSLGVVLYELTAGRRPFRGESDFMIMDQIVNQGATSPRQGNASYPEQLEAIVMRLLQRAPNARYASGEELLHDLDELVAKHHLWVSSKALGKYMRTAFATKIAEWEHAEQAGVPFAEYVVETITTPSQRSDLVTPPSAYPGLPAADEDAPAVQDLALSAATPQPTSQVNVYPVLRSGSRVRWIVTTAAAAVVVGGAMAAYLIFWGGATPHAPALSVPRTTPSTTSSRPTPPGPTPTPPSRPVVHVPPAEPAVQTSPTVQPPPPARRPLATRTPNAKLPPVRVTKPPPTKPNPTPAKPAEEPTWDPNSPFLPQ